MLQQIQHLYSTAINFEEAPVEHPADIVKGSVERSPGVFPENPRGGALSVQLAVTDTTAFHAVQTVLAAYSATKLPGTYRAVDEGSWIDVIPVQARGADGAMRAVSPLMDAKINIFATSRSVLSALDEITTALSASGYTVKYSAAGISQDKTTTFGSPAVRARDAISEIMGEVSHGMSYQALFDPLDKTYYVNIEPISLPVTPVVQANQPKKTLKKPQDSPFFIKQ
jgi:hypothetical protein